MSLIIASSHCARTDLIEFQYKSIRKFVKNDYKYYIFNDAAEDARLINFNNGNIRTEIEEKCKQLGTTCINIPQDIHTNRNILFPDLDEKDTENSVTRCADATQYMYNYFKQSNDIIVIIDADMFFINYINLIDVLEENDIAYIENSRGNSEITIEYIWNGFMIYNMKKIKEFGDLNFDAGYVFDVLVDVGGKTYFWLQNKNIKKKKLNCYHISTLDMYEPIKHNYTSYFQKYIENVLQLNSDYVINKELLINNCILHIRGAGGNWDYYNLSFKKYMSKKYKQNSRLSNDIYCNEWKNFQYEHSAIASEFLEEIIKYL